MGRCQRRAECGTGGQRKVAAWAGGFLGGHVACVTGPSVHEWAGRARVGKFSISGGPSMFDGPMGKTR
jgi:hypothetical protein